MELDSYKSAIADIYNRRAPVYDHPSDNTDWHLRICRTLLDGADLKPGQSVLDVATGTGTIALEAARKVSRQGRVVGIDIAVEMLRIAQCKAEEAGVSDIVTFQCADAEQYEEPLRFDHLFCCSALVWMSDVEQALRHWRSLLSADGMIHLQTHSVDAFVVSNIFSDIAAEMGVDVQLHKSFGCEKRLREILANAGFDQIVISKEPEWFEVSLDRAKGTIPDRYFPLPGQAVSPLKDLDDHEWAQLRNMTVQRLEEIAVNGVITDNRTSLFAHARRAG